MVAVAARKGGRSPRCLRVPGSRQPRRVAAAARLLCFGSRDRGRACPGGCEGSPEHGTTQGLARATEAARSSGLHHRRQGQHLPLPTAPPLSPPPPAPPPDSHAASARWLLASCAWIAPPSSSTTQLSSCSAPCSSSLYSSRATSACCRRSARRRLQLRRLRLLRDAAAGTAGWLCQQLRRPTGRQRRLQLAVQPDAARAARRQQLLRFEQPGARHGITSNPSKHAACRGSWRPRPSRERWCTRHPHTPQHRPPPSQSKEGRAAGPAYCLPARAPRTALCACAAACDTAGSTSRCR